MKTNTTLFQDKQVETCLTCRKHPTEKLFNLLTLLIFCIATFGSLNSVHAQITAGFELDGNATAVAPNPPDDWDLIYNGTDAADVTTGIVNDLPSANDNAFVIGSKDIDDVSTWHWQVFTTPDKDDILHAGAALYNGDQIFFFGDRYATNGNSQIGFWFFKDHVAPRPDGTFSGTHTVGDILILSNFTNGGGNPEIKAYEWVGSGGSDGTLDSVPVNGINLYAIVNSINVPSPWPYVPKTGPVNIFAPASFFEGGIDLTGLGAGINPCFTSFLLETRASASVTAELQEFVFGNIFTTPQVSVNSDSICPGGSATLTATVTGGEQPITYLWSTGATTASITVSPASTTTYTVTVTAANSCTSIPASGTVTVNPEPTCAIGSTNPANLICNSGNYTIGTTVTGVSYSWSISVDGSPPGWAIIGSNTTQSITFSSGNCGAPGFLVHITLTVTDLVTGCSSTCSVSISPGVPQCVVDIRPPVTLNCNLTSQYLLAVYSTDIFTPSFMWTRDGSPIGAGINDGVGADSILISLGGTYRFTITDLSNSANICFSEVVVSQDTTPPNCNISCGALMICPGGSNTLTASGGTSFLWSTGATTASVTVNPSATTTYTVTVTDANDCSTSSSTTATVKTQKAFSIATSTTSVSVAGNSTTTASSGGASFLWSTGATTASVTVNPTSTTTYTVTVTDANGCSSSCSTTVTVNPLPVCSIAPANPSICVGGSSTLTASGGISFLWNTGATTASITVSPTVTTTYTVTVTDANGCSSSCATTVTVNPLPPCSIGNVNPANLLCNTGNYTIGTSLSPILYSFSWTMSVDGNPPGWAIIGSNTLQTITFSSGNCGAPGFQVHFTLTVTDLATGCVSTCSISVAPGAPACIVDIRPPVELDCIVTSQYLLASYSTDFVNPIFTWTRNNVSIGAGINDGVGLDSILITLPGTYRFIITNPLNASDTCFADVTVTQNINTPTCVVNLPSSAPTCNSAGNSLGATITSADPVTFVWSSSNPAWVITSSNNVNPIIYTAGTGSTTWTLIVTNTISGCADTCTATDSCQSPFMGCTLGFWKNHPAIWNDSGDPISACVANAIVTLGAPYSGNGTTSALYRATFGLTATQMTAAGYTANLTLLQALNLGGGGFNKLARQGVASLLNSCAFPPNFQYTSAQVLTNLHNAVVNLTPEPTASQFASANETQPEGCPPGGPATPTRSSRSRIGEDGNNSFVFIKAYPNPFSSHTTIEFTVPASHATIEIYNSTGAKVAELFNGNTIADQLYTVDFNGDLYPPGVYFYRLTYEDYIYYDKLTLIK